MTTWTEDDDPATGYSIPDDPASVLTAEPDVYDIIGGNPGFESGDTTEWTTGGLVNIFDLSSGPPAPEGSFKAQLTAITTLLFGSPFKINASLTKSLSGAEAGKYGLLTFMFWLQDIAPDPANADIQIDPGTGVFQLLASIVAVEGSGWRAFSRSFLLKGPNPRFRVLCNAPSTSGDSVMFVDAFSFLVGRNPWSEDSDPSTVWSQEL